MTTVIPFDYPGPLVVATSPAIPCAVAMTVTQIIVTLGQSAYSQTVEVDLLQDGNVVAQVYIQPGETYVSQSVHISFASYDTYSLSLAQADSNAVDLGGVLVASV